MRELLTAVFRVLASVKLAVVLIAFLAAVLAVATFVETAKGREYVQWYVYHQPWFATILGLLAANILAAMLLRFPWKKSQAGFLITHVGLLLLLAGSIQTFLLGIEGQLSLEEGETGDRIVLRDYSRFQVQWMNRQSRGDRLPAIFAFQSGPVDWPEGKTLDLGALSGVELRVVRFLAHARMEEDWLRDESAEGIPALKFTYTGPDSSASGETWLVASQFGAQAAVGSARIEFQKAGLDSLVDDFLQTPAKDMDKSGVLSIHHDGHVQRIAVSENIGKKISLPSGGISVELAQYLPDARPNTDGRFVSQGKEPKNPLLELRVHLPDKKEPIRQIAFAKLPLLSLDGVHGRNSPVKFWYHHPAVVPDPGVEFLASPGGKLYYRVSAGGKYGPRGEVKPGDCIKAWAQSTVSVVKFFPHARREVSFHPVRVAAGEDDAPAAAAQVEATAGGVTRQLWLPRGGRDQMQQTIVTPEGTLRVSFGYDDLPLGFALRLHKFTRGLNPGGMGDASFASSVQIVDAAGGVREEHEISMNQPLVHGKFAFYQSGILPDGNGSVLTVACDPGRGLKYAGSLMICLGSLAMFLKKPDWCNRIPFLTRRRRAAPTLENQPRSDSCEVLP